MIALQADVKRFDDVEIIEARQRAAGGEDRRGAGRDRDVVPRIGAPRCS